MLLFKLLEFSYLLPSKALHPVPTPQFQRPLVTFFKWSMLGPVRVLVERSEDILLAI